MTTLTSDNLGRNVPIYLRNVLRNSLTDPLSRSGLWIYKSIPSRDVIERDGLPVVIVNLVHKRKENLAVKRGKQKPVELRVECLVWAKSLSDRDTIGDQIEQLFETPTSTDGTTTIENQALAHLDSISTVEDDFTFNHPDVIRMRRVITNWKYIG